MHSYALLLFSVITIPSISEHYNNISEHFDNISISHEYPKAMTGAHEWAEEELTKARKEKEDAKMVYERIKPLRQEAFRKLHEKEKLVLN